MVSCRAIGDVGGATAAAVGWWGVGRVLLGGKGAVGWSIVNGA